MQGKWNEKKMPLLIRCLLLCELFQVAVHYPLLGRYYDAQVTVEETEPQWPACLSFVKRLSAVNGIWIQVFLIQEHMLWTTVLLIFLN